MENPVLISWIKPGFRLKGIDFQENQRLDFLFLTMEGQLVEANLAFNGFVRSSFTDIDRRDPIRAMQEKSSREDNAQAQVLKSMGLTPAYFPSPEYTASRLEAEQIILAEDWERGIMPLAHQLGSRMIFAKTFVYCADIFLKLVSALSGFTSNEVAISAIVHTLKSAFPDVRDVRDSIQHLDERVFRTAIRNAKRKIISPEPIEEPAITASNAFSTGGVLNNSYWTTLASGRQGRVEISERTLRVLLHALESTYEIFEWDEHRHIKP